VQKFFDDKFLGRITLSYTEKAQRSTEKTRQFINSIYDFRFKISDCIDDCGF